MNTSRLSTRCQRKRVRTSVHSLLGLILATIAGLGFQYHAPAHRVSYFPYQEAKPILDALTEVAPVELRAANSAEAATVWEQWVVKRDAEIRSRLVQGDEDSLVNLMLFGTSFTRQPRVTLRMLAQARGGLIQDSDGSSPDMAPVLKAIQTRADDLARGIAVPGPNERMQFARSVVSRKGFDLKNAASRGLVKQYLLASLTRMLKEQAGYAKVLESAGLLDDPSADFAERSKLYAGRGLSSDTSLLPSYALEETLKAIKARGMVAAGSVRRVAVVGPGLDFTDKDDGYDFYPQQTIQPFALIDTLLRLGLARANDLSVTTLDLSPRVNGHLNQARERAARGIGYVVQLPRNMQLPWSPETIAYWTRLGDRIGVEVAPLPAPAGAGEVRVRAVRIRPSVVSLVSPEDANIVLQRLDFPSNERFDLIIATNVLVYYDVFEQSLAFKNIERMLRPGGFLLSNNALLELPGSGVHSVDYTTVVYSDRPNDGDHVVWYQRAGGQ